MAPPDSDPSKNDPVARPRRASGERPPDDENPFAGFLPRHWAMSALLGVNCFVALMLLLAGGSLLLLGPGDLLVAGAVFAPRVWDGEIWRLLTACFLHVGVWHLALNMFVLWQVGRSLEELTGGARALLVYIASGVFGFAVSVLFSRGVPSAGASGAVFGVVGAVVAIAVLFRHRRLGRVLLSTLMPFVVGNLALGFLVPFIDNAAHIGGFVMGFVLGYGFAAQDPGLLAVLLQRRVDEVHIPVRTVRLGNAALVLAGVLFVVVVPYAARPVLSPLYHAERGLVALDNGGPSDGGRAVAQEHLAACARLSPSDPGTLFLSARLREDTDRPAALKTAQAAVAAFDPDPSEAMVRAVAQLGLYDPLDDTSFAQPRAVRLLCDAALALVGDAEAAVLKNQCAWLT